MKTRTDERLIEAFRRAKPADVTEEQIAAKRAAIDGEFIQNLGRKAAKLWAESYFKYVADKGDLMLGAWLRLSLDALQKGMATMKDKGTSDAAIALLHSTYVETLATLIARGAETPNSEPDKRFLN